MTSLSFTVLSSRFHGNNATVVLRRVKNSDSSGAAPVTSRYRGNPSFLSVIQQIRLQRLRQRQRHYLVSQHVHLLEDFNFANVSLLLLLHLLVFVHGVLLVLALHHLGDQLVAHEDISVDASPPAAPPFALLGDSLHQALLQTVLVGQVSEGAADVDPREILEAADGHRG